MPLSPFTLVLHYTWRTTVYVSMYNRASRNLGPGTRDSGQRTLLTKGRTGRSKIPCVCPTASRSSGVPAHSPRRRRACMQRLHTSNIRFRLYAFHPGAFPRRLMANDLLGGVTVELSKKRSVSSCDSARARVQKVKEALRCPAVHPCQPAPAPLSSPGPNRGYATTPPRQ